MTERAALVWTILALGMVSTTPAMAQTYYPDYPVCIQITKWGGSYIDCSFTSIAQCKATASGLAAWCFANPYFAPRVQPARRR